jgi:hypothetical protein
MTTGRPSQFLQNYEPWRLPDTAALPSPGPWVALTLVLAAAAIFLGRQRSRIVPLMLALAAAGAGFRAFAESVIPDPRPRLESAHWLAATDKIVDYLFKERLVRERGELRPVNRSTMIYSSARWLLVADFAADEFIAIPQSSVLAIRGEAPGADPFSGTGAIEITVADPKRPKITLIRADRVDLTPHAEFLAVLQAKRQTGRVP